MTSVLLSKHIILLFENFFFKYIFISLRIVLFLLYAQHIFEEIIGFQIFIELVSEYILGEWILSCHMVACGKKSAIFDRPVFAEDSVNFQLWKSWRCLR